VNKSVGTVKRIAQILIFKRYHYPYLQSEQEIARHAGCTAGLQERAGAGSIVADLQVRVERCVSAELSERSGGVVADSCGADDAQRCTVAKRVRGGAEKTDVESSGDVAAAGLIERVG